MVVDHLADYWSGPVQWTNSPEQSEVLIYGPRPVQASGPLVRTIERLGLLEGPERWKHEYRGFVPTL